MLEEVDIIGLKAGVRVVVSGVLDTGTKDRAVPGMWGILGAGKRKVLNFFQGFRNVARHGDIAGAASVIPGEVESVEKVGGPIY